MSQDRISTSIIRNPLNAQLFVYPSPPPPRPTQPRLEILGEEVKSIYMYVPQICVRIISRQGVILTGLSNYGRLLMINVLLLILRKVKKSI